MDNNNNNIDMKTEDNNDMGFLTAFRKKTKGIKEANKHFDALMVATIVELSDALKDLMGNVDHQTILRKMIKVDVGEVSNLTVGRIQLLLNYLDQKQIVEYGEHFNAKFEYKEEPKKPERPEEINKESVGVFNKAIQQYNQEVKDVIYFNSKINSIKGTLSETIDPDIYGDQTLDVSKLRYVYFKFFGLDKSYIETFVKDIKKTHAEGLDLIKRIDIEDISGQVPDTIDHPFEVKFYFEDGNDAELMKGCKNVLEAGYERYCQMSDLLKQGSADWGFDLQRKDNLQTTQQATSFQGTQNMNAIQSNPMDVDTDEDIELLEEIDEEEIDEGLENLKNNNH